MIYTSYFAKLKQLPENMVPIAICAKKPQWYRGLQYRGLAPKYGFFMEWKETHDNEMYIRCFNEQVLSRFDARMLANELNNMARWHRGRFTGERIRDNLDIALLCYEKPSDFCHRHLVAEWFRKNGIQCKEWGEL